MHCMSIVKFSEVAHRANTKEDRFNTDKIYYAGGEHIESEELIIHDKGLIKGSTIGPMFYCGFKSGQILFVTRNPHLKKCGVAEFDGICSEKTFVIETKDRNVLLQEYLALVMQTDDFWNYCEENKSGGVNFFLNWSTLADYEFSLPPLPEQKALADKLWAAYRLKESYKKLLAATDEMVRAQFVEMFGTLEKPKTKVRKLLDVAVSSGQYGSNTSAIDYVKQTPRYIRITDINEDGTLNDDIKSAETYDDKYTLEINDILFARTGATVGKTYLHEYGDAIYAGYLIKYKLKENDIRPKFLKAFTHSGTYYNWVSKTQKIGAQPNISATQYDSMPVIVPSIEQQDEYIAIYNQSEQSKAELRKAIEAIDKVIKSLINKT